VPRSTKHQIRKPLAVPAPNPVKIMADGENNVKVGTPKRLQVPTLKPYFRFRDTALRAAPVLA
jgi:hypothetical protein